MLLTICITLGQLQLYYYVQLCNISITLQLQIVRSVPSALRFVFFRRFHTMRRPMLVCRVRLCIVIRLNYDYFPSVCLYAYVS